MIPATDSEIDHTAGGVPSVTGIVRCWVPRMIPTWTTSPGFDFAMTAETCAAVLICVEPIETITSPAEAPRPRPVPLTDPDPVVAEAAAWACSRLDKGAAGRDR